MRLLILAIVALCLRYGFAEEKPTLPKAPEGKTETTAEEQGGKFTYYYDADGHLTKKVDKTGATWLYSYSESGQVVREDFPDGSAILYQYENLKSKEPSKVKRLRPDGSEMRETI